MRIQSSGSHLGAFPSATCLYFQVELVWGRATTYTPFLLERHADKVNKLLVDSKVMENGSFKLILREYGGSTVCGEMSPLYLSECS